MSPSSEQFGRNLLKMIQARKISSLWLFWLSMGYPIRFCPLQTASRLAVGGWEPGSREGTMQRCCYSGWGLGMEIQELLMSARDSSTHKPHTWERTLPEPRERLLIKVKSLWRQLRALGLLPPPGIGSSNSLEGKEKETCKRRKVYRPLISGLRKRSQEDFCVFKADLGHRVRLCLPPKRERETEKGEEETRKWLTLQINWVFIPRNIAAWGETWKFSRENPCCGCKQELWGR